MLSRLSRLLSGRYDIICSREFATGTPDLSDLFDASNKHFFARALRERHLALQKQLGHQLHSTGPPHKRWLQHFSKDCLSNPLLHEGWLPWARSVKYSGHNDLKVLTVDMYRQRYDLVNKYSFSIPCDEAIHTILDFGGEILEIGSGTGYWASLLQRAGGCVTAVDIMASIIKPTWFPDTVGHDGVTFLKNAKGAADRSLLLCWPRVLHSATYTYSLDALLQAYKGSTVVWVGEPYGSCAMVPPHAWLAVKEVKLPHWACIYDRMIVYRRRRSVVRNDKLHC